MLTNTVAPPAESRRDALADESQLPRCARTRRVIEREYANWQLWMEAGRLALERYERHRPHALPSISQIARLIDAAMILGRLACGSFNPASEPPAHAQALKDLERAYGPEALAAREAEKTNLPQSPSPPPPTIPEPPKPEIRRDIIQVPLPPSPSPRNPANETPVARLLNDLFGVP